MVNQASAFVQRAFNWRTDGGEDAPVDEQQFHKAKCSIYLYYRCPCLSAINAYQHHIIDLEISVLRAQQITISCQRQQLHARDTARRLSRIG